MSEKEVELLEKQPDNVFDFVMGLKQLSFDTGVTVINDDFDCASLAYVKRYAEVGDSDNDRITSLCGLVTPLGLHLLEEYDNEGYKR